MIFSMPRAFIYFFLLVSFFFVVDRNSSYLGMMGRPGTLPRYPWNRRRMSDITTAVLSAVSAALYGVWATPYRHDRTIVLVSWYEHTGSKYSILTHYARPGMLHALFTLCTRSLKTYGLLLCGYATSIATKVYRTAKLLAYCMDKPVCSVFFFPMTCACMTGCLYRPWNGCKCIVIPVCVEYVRFFFAE